MPDPQPAQPKPLFALTAASRRTLRQLLRGPAFQSLAWLLVLVAATLLTAPQSGSGGFARFLLFATIGAIFLSWVHEGGHLIAGSLVGFEFSALIVGPLHLHLNEARVRCEWHDEALFACAVIGVPTGTDRLADRTRTMLAGGPLANLLVVVLLLPILFLDLLGPNLRLPLLGLCAMSFALAAANAIPLRVGHHRSDAARIADITGNSPGAARAAAQQIIGSLARAGIRPRDWDEGLIEQLIALEDGTRDEAFACNLALYWAHDRGDITLAAAFLERYGALHDQLPPALLPATWAEAAFFYGCWRNPPVARRCLKEAHAVLADTPPLPQARLRQLLALDLLRAEGAVLHAEGQTAVAHERLRVWLREIPGVPTIAPGLRRANIAWAESLLTEPIAREASSRDTATTEAPQIEHHQQFDTLGAQPEDTLVGTTASGRRG